VKNNALFPQLNTKNNNMIKYIETLQPHVTTNGGTVLVATRHWHDCATEFLRWQVGVYETRPFSEPLYETMLDAEGRPVVGRDDAIQYRLIGYEESVTVFCKVFRLLGFGKNLKAATAMAMPKLV
jgi:hypothetical protein